MLFRLALRNLAKTLPKRLAFGSFFAATMALLFLGNTLFENSDRGLATTYVDSFTGQASFSAPSPEMFTIFGSDLPLIGEFLILPVLPDAEGLRQAITKAHPAAQTIPQISALGQLELLNYKANVPVFGVDFSDYFHFFPALRLVSGTLPAAGERAVLLTKPQADQVAASIGRSLLPSDLLTISYAVENSVVTRKVRFAGVYTYPAADQILDKIVLTDPDTARALDGYLYGNNEAKPLDPKIQGLLTGDLEDMFSGPDATPGATPTPTPLPSADKAPVGSGPAWNFLLVRAPDRTDAQLLAELKALPESRTLQVRDWRDTAGGAALIAWFLRIVFNLGLAFIAVVSCLILINSLSLTILERTREIGTMRALGAERSFVGGLIAWETLLLVFGMGLAGVALGALATLLLNVAHLPLNNDYIASLFGSRVLHLELSWTGILGHAALGLALGLAAVGFPVRKALAIQPVKAIARDQ
jgi:putative ABC transport system permease protein